MKSIALGVILIACAGLASAEAIVDIKKIAGKSRTDVIKHLGQETSCSKSKYGIKCQYSRGETEIVFIGGKADWITIEGIDQVPFDNSALTSIGLPQVKPTFKNNFTLRWEPYQSLRSVSIFKGASNSDYAYIKAKTP